MDWRFNAYGGIYEEYGRTRNMAKRILDLLGARRFAAPLVLEGGAVHVDGEGTVLTTAEVVLDPRRNPGLEREEAEHPLCEYLGAEKVLWLSSALDHDNTGGHVDNLACFAAPGVVVRGSRARIRPTQTVRMDWLLIELSQTSSVPGGAAIRISAAIRTARCCSQGSLAKTRRMAGQQ